MRSKRIALVTGTSSGLGMYTALELAKEGYMVIATMRNFKRSNQIKELANQMNINENIDYQQLDVTKESEIKNVVHYIIHTYGKLDILMNNAGVSLGSFVELSENDDWKQSMTTNFFGTVNVTRAVLPYMRKAGNGKIINVSSVSGRFGFPAHGPYTASKFAVEGFSESLRLEMKPFNVDVILMEPGVYKTSIWDKNFNYLKSETKDSTTYAKFLKNIMRFTDKLLEGASDPGKLAKRLVKIVGYRSPRLRYTLGKGAKLSLFIKFIIPWKWLEAILIREIKK